LDTFTLEELSSVPQGVGIFCGVDEAGRGPLAGPVVAAAVIFPENIHINGISDSKLLSPVQRERLAGEITLKAVAWSIGEASSREIEEMNILEASRTAMQRAVEGLNPKPEFCLVDGWNLPEWEMPHEGIVKGDCRCFTIAAASILAKVYRDRLMVELHEMYPVYGFDRHKGYPTVSHRKALREYGPCPAHRMSFNLLGENKIP